MRLVYFLLFLSVLSFSARAENSKVLSASQEYESSVLNSLLSSKESPRPLPPPGNGDGGQDGRCPGYPPYDDGPVRGDCLDYMCKLLGSFGCNTRDRVGEVARFCRNVSPACVQTVCNRLGNLKCNDKEELSQVADMCRGQFDGRCIEYVCRKLSSFECNDFDELAEVARTCR
jgi:hypothetical protein